MKKIKSRAVPLEHSSTTGASTTAVKKLAVFTLVTELSVSWKSVLKTSETVVATANPQMKTGIT
jgi:hypothetical protein